MRLKFKRAIGASLSEPHTSVTALRTRVSIYLSVYGPTTYRKFCGFTKFVCARVHFKFKFDSEMIMEFSRSSSTTVDLLSARERLRLEREEGLLPGYSVGAKETESEDDHKQTEVRQRTSSV